MHNIEAAKAQLVKAVNQLDESDWKFMNQFYTLLKLHLEKKVAPAQIVDNTEANVDNAREGGHEKEIYKTR